MDEAAQVRNLTPGDRPLRDVFDSWLYAHGLEQWPQASDQLGREATDWLEVTDFFRRTTA